EKCKDYEITYMKNNSEVIKSEKFNTTCHKKYEEINKEVWIADYDLSGAIRDRETNLPIEGVKVDIYNKADGKLLESLTTNAEGRFASTLLDDKFYGDVIDYEFKFSAPKYLTISSELRDTLKENINFEKNLFMDINKAGLDVGKVLELNPIY